MSALDGIQIFRPKRSTPRRFRLRDRNKHFTDARRLKRIEIGLLVILIVIVAFLGMYWIGNGFDINVVGESTSFFINIDSPNEMERFYAGEQIPCYGGVVGDTLAKVNVWDTSYNVPVPCTVTPTKWGVTFYATDFSPGFHTLAVQAQGSTGQWSRVATVTVEVRGTANVTRSYMSDQFGPLAPIFRPIEDIVKGLSVHTEEGTAANDLNGNNIDDRFESNPVSPRYNPFNLPLSFILVFIVLCIVILIIARFLYSYMRRRQILRDMMAKRIVENPQRRQWYLQLKALANRQLRDQLSKERASIRAERVRLNEKVSRLESERERLLQEKEEASKQKSVKIMIIPKVRARPVQKPGLLHEARTVARATAGMTASSVESARELLPKYRSGVNRNETKTSTRRRKKKKRK